MTWLAETKGEIRSAPAEGGGASEYTDDPAPESAGWKRLMEAAPTVPHVSEEEAKAARLSPRLVQSLR